LGAGGASLEAEARGEQRPATGVEVEAARLRTSESEPGRRSVRASAVSSKSSPDEDAAEEDDSAVELRAGPSDIGLGRVAVACGGLSFPSVNEAGERDGAGGRRRRKWL